MFSPDPLILDPGSPFRVLSRPGTCSLSPPSDQVDSGLPGDFSNMPRLTDSEGSEVSDGEEPTANVAEVCFIFDDCNNPRINGCFFRLASLRLRMQLTMWTGRVCWPGTTSKTRHGWMIPRFVTVISLLRPKLYIIFSD